MELRDEPTVVEERRRVILRKDIKESL